jgi:hypothetical protein
MTVFGNFYEAVKSVPVNGDYSEGKQTNFLTSDVSLVTASIQEI